MLHFSITEKKTPFSDISYTKQLIKRVTGTLLMLHKLTTCNYVEKLSNIHSVIQHGKQPLSMQPAPDYFHYLQVWYDHTGLEFSVTAINIKRNICQICEISILTLCAGPDRYLEPSPSRDTCCRIKRHGLLSVTYA